MLTIAIASPSVESYAIHKIALVLNFDPFPTTPFRVAGYRTACSSVSVTRKGGSSLGSGVRLPLHTP